MAAPPRRSMFLPFFFLFVFLFLLLSFCSLLNSKTSNPKPTVLDLQKLREKKKRVTFVCFLIHGRFVRVGALVTAVLALVGTATVVLWTAVAVYVVRVLVLLCRVCGLAVCCFGYMRFWLFAYVL